MTTPDPHAPEERPAPSSLPQDDASPRPLDEDGLPFYPRSAGGDAPGGNARAVPSVRRRLLVGALALAAAAVVVVAVLRERPAAPATADAVVRAAALAERVEPVLRTDDPAVVRGFVRDEFGWRVGVPVFELADLQGAAIVELAPSVEVPVFVYEDARGRRVTVFTLSYALLDQVPDRLRLERADYEALTVALQPVVRRAADAEVVLWRDRDDIFLAVSTIPPSSLTDRLAMAR